jgi:hypothetical protein
MLGATIVLGIPTNSGSASHRSYSSTSLGMTAADANGRMASRLSLTGLAAWHRLPACGRGFYIRRRSTAIRLGRDWWTNGYSGVSRVAKPFGFALTEPSVRLSRTRLLLKSIRVSMRTPAGDGQGMESEGESA